MSCKLFQTRFPAVCGAAICLATIAGLEFLGMGFVANKAAAQDGGPDFIIEPNGVSAAPAELKKRFPMVSVGKRLDYESSSGRRSRHSTTAKTL